MATFLRLQTNVGSYRDLFWARLPPGLNLLDNPSSLLKIVHGKHLSAPKLASKFETTKGFYILNTKMELPRSFLHENHPLPLNFERQNLSTPERVSSSHASSPSDTFARRKIFPCRKQSVCIAWSRKFTKPPRVLEQDLSASLLDTEKTRKIETHHLAHSFLQIFESQSSLRNKQAPITI